MIEVPKGEKRIIDPSQKTEIERFLINKQMIAGRQLSSNTIDNNYRCLFDFAVFYFPKPLSEITKEEIEKYLLTKAKTDEEATQVVRKITIRAFYKSLGQENKVSHIKAKMPPSKVHKEDLPTEIEIEKILNVLKNNERNYALVALILETGLRPGEVEKLKRGSIKEEEQYMLLSVREGKTEGRRVPLAIVDSMPAVKKWMNKHPKKDSDAPLFTSIHEGKIRALDYISIWRILKEACDKAEVRHFSPKMLRHLAATVRAERGWSEQRMKEFMGWTKGSNMPNVYVHGAGSFEQTLEDAGIKPKMERRFSKRTPIFCQICSTPNDRESEYCDKCGQNLKVSFIEEVADEMRASKIYDSKLKEFRGYWNMLKNDFFKDMPRELETTLHQIFFTAFTFEEYRAQYFSVFGFLFENLKKEGVRIDSFMRDDVIKKVYDFAEDQQKMEEMTAPIPEMGGKQFYTREAYGRILDIENLTALFGGAYMHYKTAKKSDKGMGR